MEVKDFNFKFIKKFDVTDLKNEIQNIDNNLWYKDTNRQNIFRSHQYTQTIFNTSIPYTYDKFEIKTIESGTDIVTDEDMSRSPIEPATILYSCRTKGPNGRSCSRKDLPFGLVKIFLNIKSCFL
jgi:hypothetical protein